ncbi:MAG: flagella basal body P-ring formation protein FlgA [Paracoccaceae bacterium]|jgi:flagella basal body P-ring formation protein FlgA
MKRVVFAIAVLGASAVNADIVVPARTIRAKEIITAQDLILKHVDVAGALSDPADLVGQEARITLYPGRPVRMGDVGPAAIVGRNDVVTLIFTQGGLRIATEGRSLGRGAVGETVRAMNMASRTTVSGRILTDGSIEVQ